MHVKEVNAALFSVIYTPYEGIIASFYDRYDRMDCSTAVRSTCFSLSRSYIWNAYYLTD